MYVSLCKYARKQLRLLSKNKRYIYLKHLYKIYKTQDDKSKLKEISAELNTIVKFYKVSSPDLEKYKDFVSSKSREKSANFSYKI